MRAIAVLLSIGVLAAAPDEARPDSEIRALLQRVRAHQDDIDKQLENFGYIQTWKKEEGGKQKSLEISEVTFDHGHKISRLISRNGKLLEGGDFEKEQRRVERQLRDLESGKIPPLSNRRVQIEDLLRCSVFSDVLTKTTEGRELRYAEFHPDPSVKPGTMAERFAHSLDGEIWIDPQTLQIARLEFTLRDSFNIGGGLLFSMKPGSRFSDEKVWSFAKIWLPKSRAFEMNAKAMIGVKLAIRETIAFSDFHEFNVDVKESTALPAAPAIH